MFIPRKMEFKGWITDYTRSSLQEITHDEVTVFIVDWQKMVPEEFHQYIDWDQSKKDQGNWPTMTIVNMLFKDETNLVTMIGLLKVEKEQLKEKLQTSWSGGHCKFGNGSPKETLGEGARPILQGPQCNGRKWIQD